MELQEGKDVLHSVVFLFCCYPASLSLLLPVEGPLEQELACSLGEAGAALVGLQDLRHHVVQPGGPLVQRALLLQRHLEVLLQALDHTLVTLTHP